MSVNAGYAKLKQAAKLLQRHWNETRMIWRDENSRHFEENCLQPMFTSIRTAEKALGHMDDIMAKVRRDCS